ncbi:MAG: hypothetical protein ACYTG5_14185 [Planctomycetota bacterium]|jgi:pimeloyl-ACP methyl ester carboxylesterase
MKVALSALCLVIPLQAQEDFDPWGPLEAGPYAVGFRVEYRIDADGVLDAPDWGWEEGDGRPLRLFIWYPASAAEGSGASLTVGDYLGGEGDSLWEVPAQFAEYDRILREWDADVLSRQFSPSTEALVSEARAMRFRGRMNMAIADGTFPLVIHSLGRRNYQQENLVLWEYLASHGYVVVVLPQVGADTGNDRFPRFNVPAMRLQAQDMAFAMDSMLDNPEFSLGRVGAVGHSLGGMAEAFLAAERKDVEALVGLDASFSTNDGVQVFDAVDWDPGAVGVPILNAYAGGKTILDVSQLDAWPGKKLHLAIGTGRPPALALHVDFQMWPIFLLASGHEDARVRGARPKEFAAGALWTGVHATRVFFDAVLKGREDAWEELRDMEGLARGLKGEVLSMREVGGK